MARDRFVATHEIVAEGHEPIGVHPELIGSELVFHTEAEWDGGQERPQWSQDVDGRLCFDGAPMVGAKLRQIVEGIAGGEA